MHKLFHIDDNFNVLFPLLTSNFEYNEILISLYYSSISYDRLFNNKFNIQLLTQLFDKKPECMIIIFNLIKKEKWVYEYRRTFKPKTSAKPIIIFYDKVNYTKQSHMFYKLPTTYNIEHFIFI